jgi:hypothetical protein
MHRPQLALDLSKTRDLFWKLIIENINFHKTVFYGEKIVHVTR